MCLAAFALNVDPRYPLVMAANRDESFARPAAPMAWWADDDNLLAGRDLSAGGTWFGLTRTGRLALLTNVREPGHHNPAAPTRGTLVVDWLRSSSAAPAFAQALPAGFNGFNLITADIARGQWHWISNRAPAPVMLGDGIHTLSNAALNTPWPKTVGLRAALAEAIAQATDTPDLTQRLLAALADEHVAADADLPDTGVGLARERQLSPRFIRIPAEGTPARAVYGTRCATVLIQQADGVTLVIERSVGADGRWQAPVSHRLAAWPPL